ncbi:MAG: alpha/beta hydrolase [Oscillospiraceae bacterium]|nr:alpha/beta hydrolase [Oscillospiraceae bacterium]
MKCKKTVKVLGSIVLILLALWLLIWINSRIRMKQDREFLIENGYANLVSVGGRSVNVLICGNENGKHRIVAIAGFGDPAPCISWRRMTASLEEENQVIFVDRAGYGISDSTSQERTVENIVEDYRTALRNAGVEAPYTLLPHSIGGIYASYWVSQYPEEIEAVILMDTSEIREYPPDQMRTEPDPAYLLAYRLDKMGAGGLGNLLVKTMLPEKPCYSADEQRAEYALALLTFQNACVIAEDTMMSLNMNETWNILVPNDVPKLYICSEFGYTTKEELIANGGLDRETYLAFFHLDADTDDDTLYDRYLAFCRKIRENTLSAYAEKLGNCEIVLLPGEHCIYEDKPDECAEIIDSFLGQLP